MQRQEVRSYSQLFQTIHKPFEIPLVGLITQSALPIEYDIFWGCSLSGVGRVMFSPMSFLGKHELLLLITYLPPHKLTQHFWHQCWVRFCTIRIYYQQR